MIDTFNTLTTTDLLWFYLPKILVATLCGGIVGIEREIKHRATGFKTNIMIAVGSTLFAATAFLISTLLHSDPTRMIGQIVTGIGFLGAGAIFKTDSKVRGLTSAALIWVMGAIGIIIAAGGYLVSFIITLGLLILIVVSARIEKRWFSMNGDRNNG